MTFFKKHIILTISLILFSGFIYCFFTKIVEPNDLVDNTSPFYINELYYSDGRIYTNYLNNKEKKMYDFIINNVKKYRTNVIVDFNEFDCIDYNECGGLINTSYDAILVDHPELINFSSYSWNYQDNIFTLNIGLALPFSFLETIGIARVKIVVDDIKKATKDMSDEDKIEYVYNWMGKNNSYDTIFTYTSKNQSIYNVFMMHNAVCAGFAKASQIIFQNIGIESYGVTGTSTGPHMWNIVKYNDKYYYFDSTVATSINDEGSSYYDKGLEQDFMNSYIMDHPDWYPSIEKDNMFSLNA